MRSHMTSHARDEHAHWKIFLSIKDPKLQITGEPTFLDARLDKLGIWGVGTAQFPTSQASEKIPRKSLDI